MATKKEGTKGQNGSNMLLKSMRTVKPGEGRRGWSKRKLKYELVVK